VKKMKKQRLAFLLSLCWAIGMVAVFSFPPKINTEEGGKNNQTYVKSVFVPDLRISIGVENHKTPPFEVDWRLNAQLNAEWIPAFLSVSASYFAPSFFEKSRALQDIRQFFIRYFHTW
jgi:hypothetical protein